MCAISNQTKNFQKNIEKRLEKNNKHLLLESASWINKDFNSSKTIEYIKDAIIQKQFPTEERWKLANGLNKYFEINNEKIREEILEFSKEIIYNEYFAF